MSWEDALPIVIERTGVERYRWLCSDDNPDPASRQGYRVEMLRMAGQPWVPPPERVQPVPGTMVVTAALGRCCGGYNPMALDDPSA